MNQETRIASIPDAVWRPSAAFLLAVEGAAETARIKHPKPFVSPHQSYAIMLEELDEYWDEVKKKDRDPDLLLHELLDLAAVCVRAATEVVKPRMTDAEWQSALESRRAGIPEDKLHLDTKIPF